MRLSVKLIMLTILLAVTIGISTFAQSSGRDLQKYMSEVREKPYETLPASILNDNKNEGKLLDVLVPFFNDTMKVVRQKAFYITRRIGQKTQDNGIQRRAISYLILAAKEADTGIRGNALEALTQFNKASFSQAAKDSVGRMIQVQASHLELVLKLAGFLELQNYKQQIEAIVQTSANANTKWAARLALSRMGDEAATDWIVNKLNTAKVNDDFVYDVVPDLVYTRQTPVFEFLEGVINSDIENCNSANPDSNKKILCGYRVLEHIAPAIDNFPLATNESGDLNVSDYESALQQARSWFASNNSYTFKTDRF